MDITTLSLAKKYANKIAAGITAARVEGSSIILTLVDGTEAICQLPMPKDGISVIDLSIDTDGSLLCHMSDGTTIDAGYVPTIDPDLTNYYTKEEIDKELKDHEYKLPIASADTLGGIKIGENLTIDENGVVSASGGGVPVYFIENANGGNGYLVNYYGLADKTSEFTEILNDVATKGSSSFIISCYSTSVTNGRSAPGILYQAYKFTLSKSDGFIKLSGFFYGRGTTSPYRPEFNVHNAQILYSYNSSNNKYNCTEVKLLSNDKITMPLASDVLMKTNKTPYTPTSDYNPATKKYVDDAITTAITTSLEGSY